jgi:hypothetical protein
MILILLFSWIDMRPQTVVSNGLADFRYGIDHVIKTSPKARIEIAALYPTAWETVKAEVYWDQ